MSLTWKDFLYLGIRSMDDPLASPADNMDALNDELLLGSSNDVILGNPGEYEFARSLVNSLVALRSNRTIRCMPGCIIRWRFDTQIGGNPTEDGACFLQAAPGVSNVRWSGGVFRSIWNERTVGGTTHRQYPFGPVFHLLGNDILFEDVVIDGYSGIAVIVAGNDIRMINPVIRNPQRAIPADGPDVPAVPENGAGIRVYAGRGFRCRGGEVHAGNDAPLQFATDQNYPEPIEDGLFQDTRCSAMSGRVLLVASKFKAVRNVRFIGITGQKMGAGRAARGASASRRRHPPSRRSACWRMPETASFAFPTRYTSLM